MKRKPIFVAIALLLVVGAALWGVNYRLDHPPLTKADKEFRARVEGAHTIQIKYTKSGSAPNVTNVKTLNSEQTTRFVELFRITTADHDSGLTTSVVRQPLELTFVHAKRASVRFALWQTPTQGELQHLDPPYLHYKIHPRFNKRLNRALDEYLPQRVRP